MCQLAPSVLSSRAVRKRRRIEARESLIRRAGKEVVPGEARRDSRLATRPQPNLISPFGTGLTVYLPLGPIRRETD